MMVVKSLREFAIMLKQMCWMPLLGNDGTKVLHLRTEAQGPWRPYQSCPQAIPDHPIPNGSKGWATYQKLRQEGWTLLSLEMARKPVLVASGN
jgi:hypothetical protein